MTLEKTRLLQTLEINVHDGGAIDEALCTAFQCFDIVLNFIAKSQAYFFDFLARGPTKGINFSH